MTSSPRYTAQSMTKTKQGRYQTKIYDRKLHKVTTTCSSIDPDTCQSKVTKKLADLNGHAPQDLTLSQAIDLWLSTLQVRPSTMKTYQSSVKSLLKKMNGDTPVTSIRHSDILRARPTNHQLLVLKSTFNLLVRDKVLTYSPAQNIKEAPQQRKPDVRKVAGSPVLLFPEFESIANKISTSKSPSRLLTYQRNLLLITFGLSTGARVGEVMGLRWSDIDVNRTWYLDSQLLPSSRKGRPVRGPLKTGDYREIPLPDALVTLLKNHHNTIRSAYSSQPDYIFNTFNVDGLHPMEYSGISRMTNAFTTLNLSYHSFRHLNNYIQATLGASTFTRAEILGHSTSNTLTDGVYMTTTPEEKKRSMNKTFTIVSRIMGQTITPLHVSNIKDLINCSNWRNLPGEYDTTDIETFPSELWNLGHPRKK